MKRKYSKGRFDRKVTVRRRAVRRTEGEDCEGGLHGKRMVIGTIWGRFLGGSSLVGEGLLQEGPWRSGLYRED